MLRWLSSRAIVISTAESLPSCAHDANDTIHNREEEIEVLGIEVVAPLLAHQCHSVVDIERGLVGSLARESIEDVGERDDAPLDGDGFADQAVG